MSTGQYPVDKTGLLERLQEEREAWRALLDEIGGERLTESGAEGEWSVKDVLGHLTAFFRYWGAQIRGAVSGEEPTVRDLFDTDETPLRYENYDQQNAAIQQLYDPVPPAEMLSKWWNAFDLLIDGVSALAEDDLTTPGALPFTGDRALPEAMAGDTYAHAAEHRAGLQRWLAENPG